MTIGPGQNSNAPEAGRLWVQPVGNIIVARVRGRATADLIRECQDRVVALRRDTGCSHIMYDALELERPPIEIVLTQQALTGDLRGDGIRIAIVVPNTAIAYLAPVGVWRSESSRILQRHLGCGA